MGLINFKNPKRRGTVLVLMIIIITSLSVVIVASMKVLTAIDNSKFSINRNANVNSANKLTGKYICYKLDGKLYQKRIDYNVDGSVKYFKTDGPLDECSFTPPQGTNGFEITAVGGGGAGSKSSWSFGYSESKASDSDCHALFNNNSLNCVNKNNVIKLLDRAGGGGLLCDFEFEVTKFPPHCSGNSPSGSNVERIALTQGTPLQDVSDFLSGIKLSQEPSSGCCKDNLFQQNPNRNCCPTFPDSKNCCGAYCLKYLNLHTNTYVNCNQPIESLPSYAVCVEESCIAPYDYGQFSCCRPLNSAKLYKFKYGIPNPGGSLIEPTSRSECKLSYNASTFDVDKNERNQIYYAKDYGSLQEILANILTKTNKAKEMFTFYKKQPQYTLNVGMPGNPGEVSTVRVNGNIYGSNNGDKTITIKPEDIGDGGNATEASTAGQPTKIEYWYKNSEGYVKFNINASGGSSASSSSRAIKDQNQVEYLPSNEGQLPTSFTLPSSFEFNNLYAGYIKLTNSGHQRKDATYFGASGASGYIDGIKGDLFTTCADIVAKYKTGATLSLKGLTENDCKVSSSQNGTNGAPGAVIISW